jgi:hypothetical protein
MNSAIEELLLSGFTDNALALQLLILKYRIVILADEEIASTTQNHSGQTSSTCSRPEGLPMSGLSSLLLRATAWQLNSLRQEGLAQSG